MNAASKNDDPLDLTVRALLERLLTREQANDGWVNIRDERWPWRQLVAAAERGECSVSRVGRKLMMRREDLDRWLALHAIKSKGVAKTKQATESDNPVAHLLEDAGYRRRPR